MSVQPVQIHSPDPGATLGRRQPSQAEATESRTTKSLTPQDAVVVSDRARQLAAGSQQEDGGLQLDFRKLREMAFPSQPARDSAE
ncbi:MAG TPA: hypothetical protein VG692_06825 [Gemmatimonadales bacterium]|nr:hypothetical protein [Gemmatimonadales bacterium]